MTILLGGDPKFLFQIITIVIITTMKRLVVLWMTTTLWWDSSESFCWTAPKTKTKSIQKQQTTSTSSTTTTTSLASYQHALAILAMPENSRDRITNEAIVETILPQTHKLSIVLRCESQQTPTTTTLRKYVGEMYSMLWDVSLAADEASERLNPDLPDVVIYPQNLPNAAPESWIDIQPDLDGICSIDSIVGWSSVTIGTGKQYETSSGNGVGGLDEHVNNINRERKSRQLPPVSAVHVVESMNTQADTVVFVDDEVNTVTTTPPTTTRPVFLAGADSSDNLLFESVCVGGTFDGLHYGHRKLLTLAVSSVQPVTGKLLVGVTVDEMLQQKAFAEHIPTYKERVRGVKEFLQRLCPGLMNRIQILPISDSFGPPGRPDSHFDALVLSHETLATGHLLNQHRVKELNLPPLKLLCTRRTETHGMSSTSLRRLRAQRCGQNVKAS